MRRTILAALLLLTLSLWAQQTSPVDITAEPHHHKVVDNAFIRAYAVQVDPKASSLMHRHSHDYLSISLGDAEILNAKEGAQPVTAKFKDGDVRFTAAPLVHVVTDTLDTPFRNITVELMQPTTNQKACTESCSIAVPCDAADKTQCVTVDKVMGSDQWTVTRITLPAGARYPQHAHAGHFLVIPLTDADLKVKNQNGSEAEDHPKTGQVRWNDPLTHAITNAGSTPAKVVVLEFNGSPSAAK